MPAQRNNSSTLSSSSSQANLRRQYNNALAEASLRHNRTYARNSHGVVPYPNIKDMFNRSNAAVNEDDDFNDLGLSDFLLAQRRIAIHRMGRYRRRTNVAQRSHLGHSLLTWDQGEAGNETLEVSMIYTSSVAVTLMEMDEAVG